MRKKIFLKVRLCVVRRCYCIAAASASSGLVKPFCDIPGPRGPFGLGNLYNYLPVIGRYSWSELHKANHDKYEKYGPIVRETMVLGEDIVWLYDPKDIATLLNERDYPQRRSHLALEKYRKDRPHVYRSAGLLPTNGAEWWRLRAEFQKELSAPKSVRSFLPDVDKVTKEFVDFLHSKQEVFDILPQLGRLNLELTCLVTFGERLKSFSVEELVPESRSSRLMRSAEITNSNTLPLDNGLQLWRYFETPTYKKLRQAQEYMESVAIDLVKQRLTHTETCSSTGDLARTSLMEEYLRNPNLQLSDVVGMAADLLLAGIDTTSYTTAFALYHISKHKEVQEKLHQEAKRVLNGKSDELSAVSLNAPYTRAVLKEVLRLNPISVGVGRILNRDLVLSGYHVPQGTVVVTQNMVACRLQHNFADPLCFSPERWLERKQSLHPYLVLPFGHGMRACIARRLAEMNITVLLLRLLRSYKIIWSGGGTPLDVRTLLINKPSEPVNVFLKARR